MKINKNKKHLFVTRGIPGSGKSTFVQMHFAQHATIIESDAIRLKINGLITNSFGGKSISQKNSDVVWREINAQLENALAIETLVVLDATNVCNTTLLNYEKLAKKYFADFTVLDFSGVELNECKARNTQRKPEYKVVPVAVLDRMHKNLRAIPPNSPLKRYFVYATSIDNVEFINE